MATPIGADVVTSLARRFIMPQIVDVIYDSNPVWFRMNQSNKRGQQGDTQIENPFMYQRFTNGGSMRSFDVLDVAPNDTIKNGAWDWKQQYVPITVDTLTLTKTDSPQTIAHFLKTYFAQAKMEMAENLATGLWSDATTDDKEIDGLAGAVDDGTIAATYAGLARSANSWLNAQVDASTATLTEASLQSMHSDVGSGGRQATLIASRKTQYNRYATLLRGDKRFVQQPGGHDTVLADAGFTNLHYNGTPWVIDSHVPDGVPASGNSGIYFLNEDYLEWVVDSDTDFYLGDFIQPHNQLAMTSILQWTGNVICTNPARQGVMTVVAA